MQQIASVLSIPRIAVDQFQRDEVRDEPLLRLRRDDGAVVEEDAVGRVAARQELDGEVRLVAELERRVPRPPLAPEAPRRLLAPRALVSPRALQNGIKIGTKCFNHHFKC